MTKGWKIGLSIAAGFALVLMLGAGACIYYVSQLTGQVKEDQKAAERFGETADETACLNETLARSKGKSALTAVASNSIFLTTCLKRSRPTPGFCSDVPPSDDKEQTRAWIKTKCRDWGESEFTCGAIYGVIIGHCQHRPEDSTSAPEPEPTKKEKK